MYDELIKRLRECTAEQNGEKTLWNQAADAIEELQQYADLYKDLTEKSQKVATELKQQLQKSEEDNVNLTGWLAEEHAKHLWVPVTERLPEEDESVFVVRKFLGIKGQVPPSTYTEIAYRIDDNWYADSDEYKIARSKHTDPLFWMPLPEPP